MDGIVQSFSCWLWEKATSSELLMALDDPELLMDLDDPVDLDDPAREKVLPSMRKKLLICRYYRI